MSDIQSHISFYDRELELLIECLREAPADIRQNALYNDMLGKLQDELTLIRTSEPYSGPRHAD